MTSRPANERVPVRESRGDEDRLSDPGYQGPVFGTEATEVQQNMLRGDRLLAELEQNGEIVEGEKLAHAWGTTHDALKQACLSGSLFGVRLQARQLFPAAALTLTPSQFDRINRAFGVHVDAAGKLIFFTRPHGALRGRTVANAADQFEDIVRLAAAWHQL